MSLNNESVDNNHIFYDPVTILKPISKAINLNLDQLNFIFCLLLAFVLGHWFRIQFDGGTRRTRSIVCASIGLSMCYFLYGNAIIHLFVSCYGSYLLILHLDPKIVHKYVFFFAMGYLIVIHSYRWLYQQTYCLDVTGSMMVVVGKITLLASAVHDGMGRNPKELSPAQKSDAVSEIPNFFDFTSYMFNFQTVIIGPMNHYSTWSTFLDLKHVPIEKKTGKVADPTATALQKFQMSIGFAIVYSIGSAYLPMSITADPKYTSLNIFVWWFWHMLSSLFQRFSYYFAWMITDAICNISGFGFNGFDPKTKLAKWSKTTNVKPLNVEFGRNHKEMVDNWNIWTVAWLRRVVYERVDEKHRTLAVYITGAAWHGLSGGYYLSFLTSALFTLSAATFRRCVRHYFTGNPTVKMGYDIFGIIVCKFVLGYIHFAFYTMVFWPSTFMYRKLYFIPHFIAFFIYFYLPALLPPLKKSSASKTGLSEKTSDLRTIKEGSNSATNNSTKTALDFAHQLSIRED